MSAHKERQILSLTPALGRQLAAAVHLLMDSAPASTSPTAACLVPMPSAAAAVRSRGFDASWALAGRAARELRTRWGIDAVPARLLAQRHGVHDQAGLDAQARQANLAGGLRVVRGAPSGRSIILIDDVVTTGSSLAEAARTLRAAEVAIRGAATVAATVRSRPERSERNWEVPDDSC
ncbi:MAG TPA: phosphoribosyltransferase family protein [Dermatophilaceae bacterium]|nr:phosphoribosyltransferase family protein [Dermatophilaceae bacterium]